MFVRILKAVVNLIFDISYSAAEHQKKKESKRKAAYAAYLKSPAWKRKRKEVLEMAGYRCCVCKNAHAVHVHHETYACVFREKLTNLTAVCHSCHQKIIRQKRLTMDHKRGILF